MTIYSAPIDDMMFLFEHLKDNKEYNEIEKKKAKKWGKKGEKNQQYLFRWKQSK